MTNQLQLPAPDLSMFAIQVFDTVSVKWSDGRTVEGILTFVDDELHSNGRRCCIVVPTNGGNDMAPFMDQLTLTKKYVAPHARPHVISDETAERFAAYARAR